MKVIIQSLREEDCTIISAAFSKIGWHKPASQYRRYTREQASGTREVLVAWAGSAFAGHCTILWKSKYPYFRTRGIPEIMDLNVLPKFRRKKIGTRLMDHAEAIIKKRSLTAGIGVGLFDLPPIKPVTLLVFLTRCQVSSVISISTRT